MQTEELVLFQSSLRDARNLSSSHTLDYIIANFHELNSTQSASTREIPKKAHKTNPKIPFIF
jgi:hypothetical protein